MSSEGAALRAAVPISDARAEASRENGAKSRGPRRQRARRPRAGWRGGERGTRGMEAAPHHRAGTE
jgi:hypothetical protein